MVNLQKIKYFINKNLTLSKTSAALLITGLIFLLYNSPLIINLFTTSLSNDFSINNLAKLFMELSLHFFLVFLFFFCCSFNNFIFKSATFITFLFLTIFIFVYNKLGIIIDQTIIDNALENFSDASSALDLSSIVLYLIIFLIIPFSVVYKIKITKEGGKKTLIIAAIIILLFSIILSNFNYQIRKGMMVAYPPISLIDSATEYFKNISPSLKNNRNLTPITSIIPDAKFAPEKIKNLKIVLIIGESARSKNFSINGYNRKTSPLLEKENNLLSFKDVEPCKNLTSYSVSCMLSHKTSKNFAFKKNREESVIKLFNNLGFTTAWFSTQKAFGDDNSLLLLALQAQKYFFSNTVSKKIGANQLYDGYLLDFLKKEVDNPKDNFVILHTQGSHFLFDDRYPDDFKKFTPTCRKSSPKDCKKEDLINSYDNSILYSDYFISKVIDSLKDKNAILFYISDHGQFLGENNKYYHGNSDDFTQAEHRVPMFLWMSDGVLKNKFYKNKFKNANLKINTKLSHDNLFDSLLDCSGVKARILDRNLSICLKY